MCIASNLLQIRNSPLTKASSGKDLRRLEFEYFSNVICKSIRRRRVVSKLMEGDVENCLTWMILNFTLQTLQSTSNKYLLSWALAILRSSEFARRIKFLPPSKLRSLFHFARGLLYSSLLELLHDYSY